MRIFASFSIFCLEVETLDIRDDALLNDRLNRRLKAENSWVSRRDRIFRSSFRYGARARDSNRRLEFVANNTLDRRETPFSRDLRAIGTVARQISDRRSNHAV